jgi:hypothetical protein
MITDGLLFIGSIITLAFICIYYIWIKKRYPLEDGLPITIIIMPIISIIGGLLIMVTIRSIDAKKTLGYKPTANIVSIRNNDVISGSFTLGCGTIEQSEYYFYFYKTLSGGYARGKKSVNSTVIVEDNYKTPHIEELKISYESRSGWFKFTEQTEDTYRIIVPKGTVVNKFQLY